MIHRLRHLCFLFLLLLGVSLSLEQQAHAYVDPGSGLLALQSFSALVTGALFYFRRRLKSLFTRNESRETPTERP